MASQIALRRGGFCVKMGPQRRRMSSALCSPRAEEYARKVTDFMHTVRVTSVLFCDLCEHEVLCSSICL